MIGRFQRASAVLRSHLEQIVTNQPALADLPVLANVDFGHTSPQLTLPIGGVAVLEVGAACASREGPESDRPASGADGDVVERGGAGLRVVVGGDGETDQERAAGQRAVSTRPSGAGGCGRRW